MSFLGLRRSSAKVVPPTPDPPVRRLPASGSVEASIVIDPADGLVCETGLKYAEFDVEADSMLLMVCSGCNITGVVEVAECNSNTTIIADIVCVKHGEGQVNPESWYCSSTRTWRYPVINGGRASLLARSKIDIQGFGSHGIMDPCEYMMLHRKVLRECHRVFLVVHWLIGPTGQDRRIALNISGYLHYDKSDAQYHKFE